MSVDSFAQHLELLSMTATDRLAFTLTIIGSLVGILVGVTTLVRGQRKDRTERKAAERERILHEEENRKAVARFMAEFASNGGATMRDAIDRMERSHKAIAAHLEEQIQIAHDAHDAINERIDSESTRIARIYDLLAEIAKTQKLEGSHVQEMGS